MKEQLSRLLDDEFDHREMPRLLAAIREDEEMKSTWARYGAIGQVIRTGSSAPGEADLWKRVSAAIEEEPTVLAPRQLRPTHQRQRLVNFALAASLVGVALMVGKSFVTNAQQVFVAPSATAANQSGSDRIRGVAAAQSRFDDYLLAHNASAQLAGTGGMLPYARLVSVNHR